MNNTTNTPVVVTTPTSPLTWIGTALIAFVIAMGFVGSCAG